MLWSELKFKVESMLTEVGVDDAEIETIDMLFPCNVDEIEVLYDVNFQTIVVQ